MMTIFTGGMEGRKALKNELWNIYIGEAVDGIYRRGHDTLEYLVLDRDAT